MLEFDSKKIVDQFLSCRKRFASMADSHGSQIAQVKADFEQQIAEFEQRGFLTVAFIGEYSAGKSTIISALTGYNDIKISADIATDTTAEYDWNGIKIIDTPGLFTDRPDHDQITRQKIKESDLLIFTLTHSLFDSITAENFKELAFAENYKNKMMLVVNKLSSEAGDDNEKIRNYSESLQTAIEPYSLDSFPVAYIDALDYIDGVEERDEELQELSRFDSFATALNQFSSDNHVYAKLDTPVRILGAALDDAIQVVARVDLGDNVNLELLKRLSKITRRERRRLAGELDGIVLDLNNKIQSQANALISILGSDADFDAQCKTVEHEIQGFNSTAASAIEQAIESARMSLAEEIGEIFESDLFKQFIFDADTKVTVDASDVKKQMGAQKINAAVSKFESIASAASVKIGSMAVKDATKVGGKLLKNANVSGSALHKTVLDVGHKFGHKFIPYEAIKITKTLGNVAKFAGPVISILTFAADVNEVRQDEVNARKLADARKKIASTFRGIATDMENTFREQLDSFFNEYLLPVENEIKKVRDSEQLAIASSNEQVAGLRSIRSELDAVLELVD